LIIGQRSIIQFNGVFFNTFESNICVAFSNNNDFSSSNDDVSLFDVNLVLLVLNLLGAFL
jgi:hypothetical protein